jgi:hypothetical protein
MEQRENKRQCAVDASVAREWTKAVPDQINQTSTYDRGKVKLRRIPLAQSAAEWWFRQS